MSASVLSLGPLFPTIISFQPTQGEERKGSQDVFQDDQLNR